MTKPTKPPKMKPVKAWAIIRKDNTLYQTFPGEPRSRVAKLVNVHADERIVRVLITEVPR